MVKTNHITFDNMGEEFYTQETKRHRELIRKIKKGQRFDMNKDGMLCYDD